MGKGKKSKNVARNSRDPGAQGQQQTGGTAAKNPQTPNSQKKRASDGEAEGGMASKYVKTNAQPQERVPAPKPALNQTDHTELDTPAMEQDSKSGSEKENVIPEMPEIKEIEDKLSIFISDLDNVEAAVRKLQKKVKNFKNKVKNLKKKLEIFNEDREY
ncbi:hypothetical protein F4775DRAFT_540001 [Biscogniauxia sp. FL1348]|nr:hypothetical protein F4775DRAFT_540001 [Biscogniauxia sp. FL1348]